MLVREYYQTRSDGVQLFRTYSDTGCFIQQTQTGVEYAEAIDVDGAPFIYTETGNLIADTADPDTVRQLEEIAAR